MAKKTHEVRDPIHTFVRYDSAERKVIDSRPFQRLRHIHQLAMTYLVYPGATHRRFEHSLGVMELAGRVFDVVTHQDATSKKIKRELRELTQPRTLRCWRRALRMAALCHDLGHLPFSHAAEKELLPKGWSHELITKKIILSGEMRRIWQSMKPKLQPEHIVKLALGPKEAPDLTFSNWEVLLAEIITGDAFGVDRMDYLLRDSHHAGVPYGRIDHFRLIDTMRILPAPPAEKGDTTIRPSLGIEEGGIHCAAALLLARYFMFSQLYFHPVRRIYDIHLKDFLKEWLPGGRFSTSVRKHLLTTDNEVSAAILEAARNPGRPGHGAADRIVKHRHFKEIYRRNPDDSALNPEAGQAIFEAARHKYGDKRVRHDRVHDRVSKGAGKPDFPVLTKDKRIVRAAEISEPIARLPGISVDYVFVDPVIYKKAWGWLRRNRTRIIRIPKEQ